jgi:hypothetical protein
VAPDKQPRRVVSYVEYPTVIEGIPHRHMMMEGAEIHTPDSMPIYSAGEMARTFLAIKPSTLYKYLGSIPTEEWDAHLLGLPRRAGKPLGRESWSLADVERIIHLLKDRKLIKFDRFVVALQLVAWTGKAYGVYV